MRHGLHLLGGRPHQLAGAVLDALVTAVEEVPPFYVPGSDEADRRVLEAVHDGFRLSAIGGTTGHGRAPNDVRRILDLMAPENVPEPEVFREREPDLFGSPGQAGRVVNAMLRNPDGRPGAIGTGLYWHLGRLGTPTTTGFMRLCRIAADLVAHRDAECLGCCATIGLLSSALRDREDRLLASLVTRELTKSDPALGARVSVLQTGELVPSAPGAMKDWADGHGVEAFTGLVLVYEPRGS